ncbi:MAG: hypothetical protein NC181_04005 [Clostridium sp.]|nr:hypothetical protein [Clostridium sp.]MCM1444369.1 hypothetical protein [Candidatus Amulumruptor caecigallinarius]
MKKMSKIIISMILIISLTGCKPNLTKEKLSHLDDGYVCEYRYGKNARYSTELVDINFEFDSQMFIELYNEKAQYNPVYLRKHIEKCDLKLESGGKEIAEMLETEISIRAAYQDTYKEVVVYKYDDDLYFFVLSMGGRTEKDKEGWYFMRVSDNLQKYWKQLTNQIYK